MATTFLNGTLVSSADSGQNVVGSSTNDLILSLGTLDDSTISGIQGFDTIAYAGQSDSSVFNGDGQDDEFYFNSLGFVETNLDSISVFGGTGDDYITFGVTGFSVPGFVDGEYVNIIDSLIRGEDGDDEILFGEDTTITGTLVNGNKGEDLIDIENGLDDSTIQGGKDNDTLYTDGDVSASVINGNLGNDVVDFDDGIIENSSIFGGQGDDELEFDEAPVIDSLISGDLGADYIDFESGNSFEVLLQNSTVLGGQDADYIEIGLEKSSSNNDSNSVQVDNSLIDGGTGNDTIVTGDYVRLANTTVLGGVGNDQIVISIGDGIDTVNDWGGLFNSLVDGGQGNDTILVANSNPGGGAGASTVLGGDGSDRLIGNNDNTNGMVWDGEANSDLMVGNGGRDTMSGGTGDDTISGGLKGDRLTGGAGNDLFDYSRSPYGTTRDDAARESFVTGNSAELGSNIDFITDFVAAEDRIRLPYEVTSVIAVSAGFSTDWQTTANAALGETITGFANLGSNQVALLTIDSGDNAGTYLLFQSWTPAISPNTWSAESDSIIALASPTGTFSVTSTNFITGGTPVSDFDGVIL